jgi:hypothetical protein
VPSRGATPLPWLDWPASRPHITSTLQRMWEVHAHACRSSTTLVPGLFFLISPSIFTQRVYMLFSHNKLSSRGGSVKHEIPGTHIYCSCPDRHAGQLDSSAINTELKDRVKKSEA